MSQLLQNELSMTNKKINVLITGCSDGGIGAALAKAFHSRGYRVFATARNIAKMSSLAALGIEVMPLDILDSVSIASCVELVAERTNDSLHILINNAGFGLTAPVAETPISAAQDLFNTNFFGQLRVIQAFLPLLVRSASSSKPSPMIVNNTSIVGSIPVPWQGVYNASKAALSSLTDTSRLELEPFGIRVVDLKTGVVASKFFDAVQGMLSIPLLRSCADKNSIRLAAVRPLCTSGGHSS